MPKRAMPSTFTRLPCWRSSSTTNCTVQAFAALVELRGDLECFVGVDEDRDRAFIDQLHGHHSLKNSRGYGDAQPLQSFAEFFIQLLRQLRRSRGNKTRPALPAR